MSPLSLPPLMKKILRTELTVLKLKQVGLVLSLDINDPDGGLDAYVGTNVPKDHPWIPAGKSGWQFKAEHDFPTYKVTNEVLNKDKTDLKPRIKKLLDENGTYVLVIGGKDYVPADLEEREEQLRMIFTQMGYPSGKGKIFSSGQVADWASSLPTAVAHLKPDRNNFKDFYEWQKSMVWVKGFVADSERRRIIIDIRAAAIANQKNEKATIIRLVGHSGVGKTRLAYECLSVDDLREVVLYLDSPDKLPSSRFNEIARVEEIRVILVVDECSHDRFVELAKEAETIGGRLTLIALDYDIDHPRDAQDIHLILNPLDRMASEELIKATVSTLPENALKKIAEYSEGFPRILIALSDNFSSQPEFLSPMTLEKLGLSDLLDRIITGRVEGTFELGKVRNTLTVISLFKRLGWDDEASIQGKKVCELHGINWMDARRVVEDQEKRKLVAKRGRYRFVTPLPLAINLASGWLSSMDKSTLQKYFKDLPDAETKKAFLERLTELGYTEYAQEALKDFLSSFDYQSLDTSAGSEIFLNLSKADHTYSMEILERILGPLSHEKLLEFKTGRRNIVWALEKIAWWGNTFSRSARLLLKLAEAENEEWSNNATGTFIHLFQTYLGGTEVPVWERHLVLEEALCRGNKNMRKIALKGIDATLQLAHAYRMGGAEEQGVTIVPPEWNPRSGEDIQKAVVSAFALIDRAMQIPDMEIQLSAASLLLSNTRILLAHGFLSEVMDRLNFIQCEFQEIEKKLIKTIENVLYYDKKKLPEKTVKVLQMFRDSVITNDYHGLMKRYVKSNLIEDHIEDKGVGVEEKIKELARISISSPAELESELAWLATDQAENGYLFGKALGELDKENKWLKRIEDLVRASGTPSILFFSGYLYSAKLRDERLYVEVLGNWLKDEKLSKLLPELVWRSGTSDRAAELITKMLKERKIDPAQIRMFAFGAWFSKVSVDTFIQFLEEFYSIDEGKHAATIIGIIDQYVERNRAVLEKKDVIIKYLAVANFEDEMEAYYWDKLSHELMEKDSETVPFFVDVLTKALAKEDTMRFEHYVSKELQYFLNRNANETWEKLKKILLVGDLSSWRLAELIRGEYGVFNREGRSLLPLVPEEELWKWVDENPSKASYMLARIIPLHEAEPLLHPIARKLLIKFPEDKEVQEVLSSNWHTEGFSGKASSHYQCKLNIAQEWLKDSEPPISKWASNEIFMLKEMIASARIREEEEEE